MKKITLLLFTIVFFFACSDADIDVVTYADYSSDISYKVGSIRDKRLTFFDINEFKQIRSIPNNLSTGSLAGRVQFAQTHTIDPNNNEARNEPSLIPYRTALLLFTPQEELQELSVKVDNGNKTNTFKMVPPPSMPKSDYNNRSGTKPDITYSKRSWSVQLPNDFVTPKMNLEFTGITKTSQELSGSLFSDNIEFAAPIEGAFLFIRLGMLTDDYAKDSHDMLTDSAHAMQEYFQTVPFAKLFHGYYEDRLLKKVIISSGKIYTNKSDYVGANHYSGDMREDVAKAQVSVGIDFANKGVIDSPLNQKHQIAHDMFYFTVHHANGKYTDENGKAVTIKHGLSGGNGIGTLSASTGNEFSHEVGHGYGMGHFPFINDASNGSVHGYSTSWGYDAYKHRMRANVAWNSTPNAEMFQEKWFITPFQNYYNWNRDSMAGGSADSAISRYTHSTARSTRQIQKNIADKYFLSDEKNDKGEYYYRSWDKVRQEYSKATEENFLNNRINPTQKGVPVITILGGYDPQSPYNAVIYPYFRGNWGNVFASIFKDSLPDNATSYLEITYYDNKTTQYVVLSDKRYEKNIINKFHINIAERDKPETITLYVNKAKNDNTTINKTVYSNPLSKAIVIGRENGYQSVIDNDTIYLNDLLLNKAIDNYTLSAKEKEIIEILYRYNKLNNLLPNQKAVAQDYINKKNKIDEIDMFIYNNYELLENNNMQASNNLKNMLSTSGLGTVEFKFNQAEINGKCIEVYSSEASNMAVRVVACNDSKNQRWARDKSGRIHSAVYPGYCLGINNMEVLQLCSDNPNQQWKVSNSDISNGFVFENIGTAGKCIDNSGSNPEKIISYNCTGNANQRFKQITEDENIYFSLFDGSLIEEIWKYIPAESEGSI